MNEFYDYSVNLSTIWITVNRTCNFRCKWCYAECSEYKKDDDMSLESAKRIVDVSKEAGAKHVILIGGEPTMWKHVFELSNYCKEKSISCGMVTNACLFGNDLYYEKFLKSPFSSVGISIKGITEKQFENVVGDRALYQQTITGLRRLLEYYSNMSVSVVYSNLFNYDDLLEIASVSHDMGAKMFQLGGCSVTINGECVNDDYMVNREEFVSTVLKIYPILDEMYDGRVILEPRLPLCSFPQSFLANVIAKKQLQNMCHVQNRSGLVFDSDGYVLPCNSMIDVKLGKIGEDFSTGEELLEMLENKEIRDGYKVMLRYPSSECNHCDYNDYCRGGCIINWTVLDPSICHSIIKPERG